MQVHNFGSINLDLIYRVPHIAAPGETLASSGLTRGLGGKGANMSVALASSGATVRHYGAVGGDGLWVVDVLRDKGVICDDILVLDRPTGQAIIMLDDAGENAITLLGGANRALPGSLIDTLLGHADPGDWLLVQNETNAGAEVADKARRAGLKVAYAAAPFTVESARAMAGLTDLLAVNGIEAQQMEQAMGQPLTALGIAQVLVTRGADGATFSHAGAEQSQPAFPVTAIRDTTGAGDTFLGFLLGRICQGDAPATALKRAAAASALAIQKDGAIPAIPLLSEVLDFLDETGG